MSKPSKGRGVDQKGNSKKDARHVRVYLTEMATVAFGSLDAGAQALLLHLKSLYSGSNNGELFLSVRDGARRLNSSKSMVASWFRQLQDRGFIRPKVEAGFNWKTAARARKATCWILTEYPTEGAAQTRDFQHWKPTDEPPAKSIRRSIRRTDCPIGGQTVHMADSNPASPPNLSHIPDRFNENAPESVRLMDTDSIRGGDEGTEGPRRLGTVLKSLDIPVVVRAGGRQPTPGLARAATGKRSAKPSTKKPKSLVAAAPCRDETRTATATDRAGGR